jgi:Fe-S-cluster-containing hydrogenase component 2/CRP-like cAMP-binding protein
MDELDTLYDFDLEGLPAFREEESIFSRGEDDQLIKYSKPTGADFVKTFQVIFDGEFVEVPKALPATDALGNFLKDKLGNLIARDTTIYDVAEKLVSAGRIPEIQMQRKLPVLCHQKHLEPIAVCRVCSVHISKIKRGKFEADRKLHAACIRPVEDKMAIVTGVGPQDPRKHIELINKHFEFDLAKRRNEQETQEQATQRAVKAIEGYSLMVRQATGLLGEMLAAECLRPDPERGRRYDNELSRVAAALGVGESNRFSRNPAGELGRNRDLHPKSRPLAMPLDLVPTLSGELGRASGPIDTLAEFDPNALYSYSSRSIHVDHDRCILCDRCARSCSEVKPFKVIGHTGKGFRTRISFDLDLPMNDSTCVQCGECMTACPTGALTLDRRVSPRSWDDQPDPTKPWIPIDPDKPLPAGKGFLTAAQMQEIEIFYADEDQRKSFFPFRNIPYPYLLWNEGAVRRRLLEPNEALCKQGDFGSTAFLLVRGDFIGTRVEPPGEGGDEAVGFWGRLTGRRSAVAAPASRPLTFQLSAERDLVLGEIACLTNDTRTATVTAATHAEVLEVTRNMLAMLRRNPAAWHVLDTIYCRRAVNNCLNGSSLFAGLSDEQRAKVIAQFEKDSEVIRVKAGEAIVVEGARVGYDDKGKFHGDLYIIVLGFVKVSRTFHNQERVLDQLTKGKFFGETALLADHPIVERARLEEGINPSQRTATCSALGDVEVVRVPGGTFRQFFKPKATRDPEDAFAKIADRIATLTVERLREQKAPPDLEDDRLGDFLGQGLYQSRKMLVLDLLSCTRCDECTRACADAHGDGHSRLLREGLRFGDFLVAASCRSCHQPYCMDGCPVDAIHRDPELPEILIEGHCIGCSLCEKNCPYGSIQMVPKAPGALWSDLLSDVDANPQVTASIPRRALNCDLCHGLVNPGKEPFCVSACPHEAAFRWDGPTLKKVVEKRSAQQY